MERDELIQLRDDDHSSWGLIVVAKLGDPSTKKTVTAPSAFSLSLYVPPTPPVKAHKQTLQQTRRLSREQTDEPTPGP